MACHCFSWATGIPTCVGRIPGPFGGWPVENCRSECRRLGMGVLCHEENGDCFTGVQCGNDGLFRWRRAITFSVLVDCPLDSDYFLNDVQGVVYACSATQPPDSFMPYPIGTETVGARIVPCGSEVRLDHQTVIWTLISYDASWFRSPPRAGMPDPCGGSQSARTPCCIPGNPTPCQFITPQQCIQKCGQPFEGANTLWTHPENPCLGTGNSYPCNLKACCIQPYPSPYPPTTPVGLEGISSALRYRPYCNVITPADCGQLGGTVSENSRSCFRPGSCFGEETDPCLIDGHCVGGFWELVYRPEEHKPPIEKDWLDGSAEIVSQKPERLLEPDGGPLDCKYHYGDVTYSIGPDGISSEAGSAAGVVCAVKASRQADDSFNTYNWCPLVYGADGNARFSCGYRIAEN